MGSFGVLGNGLTSDAVTPYLVPSNFLQNIVYAFAGRQSSFFLNNSGSVFATGANTNGVYATGNQAACNPPCLLTNSRLKNITRVCISDSHASYLSSSGSVFTVGYNNYGELGL